MALTKREIRTRYKRRKRIQKNWDMRKAFIESGMYRPKEHANQFFISYNSGDWMHIKD